MANIKIGDLVTLTDPISTDVLPIVDVSADTTNKVTIEELLKNAAAGTAAAPAFAFDADPNTGMYRSGADALAFSTAGTGRLFIDSSGRLLLGTTTEGNASADNLTIADSGNCGITIRSGSSNFGEIYFSDATSGGGEYDGYIAYSQSSRHMALATAQAEAMRIDSSGNTGIGTSTPGSFDSEANKLVVGTGTGDQGITIYSGPNSTDFGSIFFADGTSGGAEKRGQIRYQQSSEVMSFITNTTERMRLDSSGNLGLGTTSPAGKLTVYDGSSPYLYLQNSTSGTSGSDGFSLLHSGVNTFFANRDSGYMAFETGNSERVRLDSSGNLGLGTTSPGGKLDVRGLTGTTIIRAVGGDTNGYADAEIFSTGTAGSSRLYFSDTAAKSGSIIYSHGDNQFRFATSGSTALTIDSSQQVGIGTTTPGNFNSSANQLVISDSGTCGITIDATSTTSSRIHFADGTTGDESYRGIIEYAHGSDAFFLSTAGSTALTIDSSQQVGIGTTSPSSYYADDLVVVGSAEGGVTIAGPSSGASYLAFADGTSGNQAYRGYLKYDHSNDSLSFASGAGVHITSTATGKIGVGTSAPDFKFHSLETGGSSIAGLFETNQSDTYITFQASGTTASSTVRIGANADDFVAFVNGSERLRIKSDGKLGVGTSAPTGKLSINASALDAVANKTNSSAYGLALYGNTTTGTGNGIAFCNDSGGHVGGAIIHIDQGSNNLGDLAFYTAQTSSNPEERMRIKNDGKVGIKTSAPATELDVNGSIRAVTSGTAANIFRLGHGSSSLYLGIEGSSSGGTLITGSGANNVELVSNSDMRFSTSNGASSQFVIQSTGIPQFTSTGSVYADSTAPSFVVNSNGGHSLVINNTNSTDPRGLYIYQNTDANDSTSYFLRANGGGTNRAYIYSNGGFANYQSNDSNLCDEREKKNIETLNSTWNCLKSWELKKFHYNEDADTDDKRYGVIAQQIASHCPEVISDWVKQEASEAVLDDDGNVVTPAKEEIVRMGVKEQQMMWMAIKALQEAQARIETLEQRLTDAGL